MVNATKDLTESSNARGVRLPGLGGHARQRRALPPDENHQENGEQHVQDDAREHDPEHGEMRDAGGGVCGLGHRDFLFVGTDAG